MPFWHRRPKRKSLRAGSHPWGLARQDAEEKDIAQSALAEQLSRDQSYVSRLEGGHRRVTVRDVFAWAVALDASWEAVSEGLREAWDRRGEARSLWEES